MSAGRIAREVATFTLPAFLCAALVSSVLAREQTFLGTFDLEQIYWQGLNLLNVFGSGNPRLHTSFLGVDTPYTYSPSMHAYSMPLLALSWLTNPWFAANLMTLSVLILNGAAMYAFLRAGGLHRAPAALGGIVFFATPALVARTFVHPYLAEGFFLPAIFLIAWRDRTEGYRAWHWVALGAIVALMFGAHEYHGIGGAAVVAVVVACALPRLGWRRVLAAAGWCLTAFIILTAPILWMYFAQRSFDRAHGVKFERPLEESIIMSSGPVDFLLPSVDNPLYRKLPLVPVARIDESFNYLGLLNLASLALLLSWALFRRDRLRAFLDASPMLRALHWELSLTAAGALAASLGPRLKPSPRIWMPMALLLALHVPPFTMMRGWARYGWMVSFVLTVLTAHLAAFLAPRRRWLLLIAALAVLDQASMSYLPTFRVARPSAIEEILAEPGDCFVLHLPFGSRSGALHNGVGQLLQWFHGKRLVGGYAALDNPLFLEKVASSPLAAIDCQQWEAHPRPLPGDLYTWMVTTDIRFVVYEKKTQFYTDSFTPDKDAALRRVTLDALRPLPLDVIEDDDDYTVYRVRR